MRDFGRWDRCAMVGSLAWGVSRRFGWGRDGGTWKGSRDHVIVWRCWEDVWLGISFVAIAMFDLENFIQLFSIRGMQSSTSHREKGRSCVSIRHTHHK